MSTPLRNLIVTGATGKQGGALISALLSKGSSNPFKIYAVTRKPNSSAAQSLASKANVTIVQGDLDNSAEIFAKVPQPWGVFGVTMPLPSARIEEANGKKLVDAAVTAVSSISSSRPRTAVGIGPMTMQRMCRTSSASIASRSTSKPRLWTGPSYDLWLSLRT